MPLISLHSPIGDLSVAQNGEAIVAVDWGWGSLQEPTPLLQEAAAQLQAYFDGEITDFDLPLEPFGSLFQKQVWQAMLEIPAGSTRTYGDIARELGSSARAVGMACGANPIPVIIPCHRVVAANALGGYSGDGGLDSKIALLRLERVLL